VIYAISPLVRQPSPRPVRSRWRHHQRCISSIWLLNLARLERLCVCAVRAMEIPFARLRAEKRNDFRDVQLHRIPAAL